LIHAQSLQISKEMMRTFTTLREMKEQAARSTANNVEESRVANVDLHNRLNSDVGQACADRLRDVGKPKPFVGI
jgi:hypothetical protein